MDTVLPGLGAADSHHVGSARVDAAGLSARGRAQYQPPRPRLKSNVQKYRTLSPLERLIREIRRRTRVVGAFPDGKSALKLVAATRWGDRIYALTDRRARYPIVKLLGSPPLADATQTVLA